MLVSLDIETKRADHITKEGARDYDALIPHKAQITVIGLYAEDGTSKVFRGPNKVEDVMRHLSTIKDLELTGQNLKFDIKHLVYHGADAEFLIKHWKHDSQLLGYVNPNKINQAWLDNYEEQRAALNKTLPRGVSHRAASLHSLKTMAPYFLDVEPFWEDPSDHNNDEYVIKDCKYTLELTQYFLENLHQSDLAFYNNHQLPWTKELLRAELKGIDIDTDEMHKLQDHFDKERAQSANKIAKQWEDAFKVYANEQFELERERIEAMRQRALLRVKDIAKCHKTHDEKIAKIEVAPFNLDSPTQLKWLLRDYLQLDITKTDGSESTDKEVLETLAATNNEVQNLLDYRKYTKLCTSYFPSYKDLIVNGKIHTVFNPTGTRTGRLSSSHVNLQQVPKEVRPMFRAPKGYKYISLDLGAIEPRLLAYYSEDKTLCDVFLNNGDFHGTTAIAMFDYIDCNSTEVKKLFPKERGVAKCVSPETRLLTAKGFIKIGELQTSREADKFFDIDVEIVGPKQKVIKASKFYSNGKSYRKRILTKFGQLICSNQHKFLTKSNELVMAKDLQIGDEVVYEPLVYNGKDIQTIPIKLFKGSKPLFKIDITKELSYILGLFVGDGSAGHDNLMLHSGGIKKEQLDWSQQISDICNDLGLSNTKGDTKLNKTGGYSQTTYIHGGTHMTSVFEQLEIVRFRTPEDTTNFRPIKTFKIPEYIFNSPKDVKMSFLAGLIDSDGWVSKKGAIGFCSKESQLASDFTQLMHSMGLRCSISLSWNKTYKKMYYKCYISANESYMFKDYLKVSWKNEKLYKPKNNSKSVTAHKILEIENLDEDYLVDITVDTYNHLYNSSGFITHNTLGLSILYGSGIKMVKEILIKQGFTGYSESDYKKIVYGIRDMYKDVWRFKQDLDKELESGAIIYNILGRPFKIENKDNIYMTGMNTLIQGSASDIVQESMYQFNQKAEDDARVLALVHDEIFTIAKDFKADYYKQLLDYCMTSRVLSTKYGAIPLITEGEVKEIWTK